MKVLEMIVKDVNGIRTQILAEFAIVRERNESLTG